MANLFAVADREPGFLDALEKRLVESGEFEEVYRPCDGWVTAVAPLPESGPEPEQVRARGFAFAEGRDRLESGDGTGWLDRLDDLVERAPASLDELPGDFSFLRFRLDGTAAAVRSCAGTVPIYYHRRPGGGLALGTRLNFFPRFLPGRFQADPFFNVTVWQHDQFVDGRTFVEDVAIVPNASHTELGIGRAPKTTIYWDPQPPAGTKIKPSPDHPRELRALLVAALDRDLDDRGRNLLMLSGGIDSCSLGALAGSSLGHRFGSWSLVPPYEPERSREFSYMDRIVSMSKIDPVIRTDMTMERYHGWLEKAPGLPCQTALPQLSALPDVLAEHDVRVQFGGEFADQVCGHWVRITDWTRETSLAQLITRPHALPFGPRDYGRWVRRRYLDAVGRPVVWMKPYIPPWARPEIKAEWDEWYRGFCKAHAEDERPLKELAARAAGNIWVTMNWEASTELGVRRSNPFWSREVLELAFRCHPHELLGPGVKRLLRDALADDVPAANLERPDKGSWGGGDRYARLPVPSDPELPAGAERLVRSDLSPAELEDAWAVGSELMGAVRVIKYLDENSLDQEPAAAAAR